MKWTKNLSYTIIAGLSADNFPWAIVVNDISTDETTKTSWVWPNEKQIITKSYTRFADWVNGKGAKNWMFQQK
ncbi:MAG TPA: DUF4842 domain-containing protein [Bacteroidaceae bacterium]|nr:DUF4842 domain-containing protein [Bacteroidaceae bacterium]